MTNKILVPAAIAAAMVVSGLALAQNTNQGAVNQPATKQSAPANAPEASGHDAQTGQPASGEAVRNAKTRLATLTRRMARTTARNSARSS